jgi:hypothetical protein
MKRRGGREEEEETRAALAASRSAGIGRNRPRFTPRRVCVSIVKI